MVGASMSRIGLPGNTRCSSSCGRHSSRQARESHPRPGRHANRYSASGDLAHSSNRRLRQRKSMGTHRRGHRSGKANAALHGYRIPCQPPDSLRKVVVSFRPSPAATSPFRILGGGHQVDVFHAQEVKLGRRTSWRGQARRPAPQDGNHRQCQRRRMRRQPASMAPFYGLGAVEW